MKKLIFLTMAICLFSVTQVFGYTLTQPFLTDGGVVSSPITTPSPYSDTYDVYNRANTTTSVNDVWNDTWAGYEWDGSTGYQYSGYYIGTFGGNDSEEALRGLVQTYLGEQIVSSDWYKVDSDSGGTSGPLSYEITDYKPAPDDDEGVAGTWSITDPNTLHFYSVKGSSEFALYFLDPSLSSGYWSTRHLLAGQSNNPAISHFSAIVAPAPIPEPATMLLFGTGLAGLAGVTRRMKK